jgi:hypothetical protein
VSSERTSATIARPRFKRGEMPNVPAKDAAAFPKKLLTLSQKQKQFGLQAAMPCTAASHVNAPTS